MTPITVTKCDHKGRAVFSYEGKLVAHGAHYVYLEAYFARDDFDAGYMVYRRGDRFMEWFYADRWYNVFQIFDVHDGRLKGWYCNITRPALLDLTAERANVRADDLALDVFIHPDGTPLMLDRDEFDALDLPDEERRAALDAAETIQRLAAARIPPFALAGG